MPKVKSLDPAYRISQKLFDYIKGEMKRQGITQQQMAKELCMYQSGLSYKFHKRAFYVEDIIRIFQILKTPAEVIGELMT